MASQLGSFVIFCSLGFIIAKARPNDFSVRLIEGSKAHEGFLEVFQSGSWRKVSNSKWDIRGSIVICKQLGYDNVNPESKRYAIFIALFLRNSVPFIPFWFLNFCSRLLRSYLFFVYI